MRATFFALLASGAAASCLAGALPAMAQSPYRGAQANSSSNGQPSLTPSSIGQSSLSQSSGNSATASLDTTPRPVAVHASVTLSAGNGQVLHLNMPATNVFTADPKVAEVRPASANSLFVFGVAPGITTVAALDTQGQLIGQYTVTVLPSGFDAAQARSAISRSGGSAVHARATETGVTLNGHVATPNDAEVAVQAAKGALPPDGKVTNNLDVDEPIQVSLHVRVAEMTRTLTRELGINWTAIGALGKSAQFGILGQTNNQLQSAVGVSPSTLGIAAGCGASLVQGSSLANCTGPGSKNFDLSSVIDALSQDQLVHVLAEPNLTTMSGQPASFLVGGEFPIPVANSTGANATISVDFKQYGISLAFVPTVLSHGRISIHVRPEVSQLDKADGVTSYLGTGVAISIPALTVRRADTTVELGSGQSFAIAGLLSDQTTQIDQSTPWLGDVPMLGALFRSESFQRGQTELVIVVTPYIVRPVSDPRALHLPTDGYRPPNDFERILLLRQVGRTPSPGNARRFPSDAGFMVE
jgi:pilus assembly protein CpaC